MPTFMHQWNYKDPLIREFLQSTEPQTRADIVRVSIEAFGGKLVAFYFSFGKFDGVAISEFADERTALACVMSIFGQGRVQSVCTSTLFSPADIRHSIGVAKAVLAGQDPPKHKP